MNKIKLIFFDMEGTLFKKAVPLEKTRVAPSAWAAIAQSLGSKAVDEENETQDKWNNGEYSGYIEWMEDTVKIHKKYKLRRDRFCKILDSIDYSLGVKDVFKIINRKNIPTCLISGGFKYQADKALKDLRIKHAFVGCEYFWGSNGLLDNWNLLPADERGKRSFMKLLIKEYGFTPNECAFVGDGQNDILIAKAVGVSISFNGSEKLANNVTYVINQKPGKEDFRAIMKYIAL